MLKSKTVAKLIETTLNRNDKDEQFRVVYEVGSYKGTAINCILKQGKGTIRPIANYTNINTPFHIEIITPMQCGEDRLDTIVDVVNDTIKKLNGVVKTDIDGGKAVFLFSPLEIGNYETRATAGQSVLIKLEFSVEYSSNTGTKYEMALITNEFVGTIDTMYFENQADQVKWFNSKIKTTNAQFNEVLVPNTNSMVITSQRYLNSNNVNINDLLMYNYAIIRETKSSGEINHYYYEITNSSIDQYNLLALDLKMDTLQTWYFNPNIKFDDCFISKADINRWVDNGDGTVSFDTRPESELFEREDIQNVTKRLVSREVLPVNGTDFPKDLREWLDENVAGWYYIYMSSNSPIPAGEFSSAKNAQGNVVQNTYKPVSLRYVSKWADNLTEQLNLSIYNPLCCIACPVFKELSDITFVDDLTTPTHSLTLTNTPSHIISELASNYIYAIKFSQVPPFNNISEYKVSGKILKIKSDTAYASVYTITTGSGSDVVEQLVHNSIMYPVSPEDTISGIYVFDLAQTGFGALNVRLQTNVNIEIPYTQETNYTFSKKEIIDAEHDIKFNPKLLSSDYSGLILSDSLQNGAEYDILKLGKKDLIITYTEALTPDITKKYIRFSGLDGYYISETSENLTGYVVQDDTSLTIEGSQYQSMLANNKNFFLQNSINRDQPFITGITTGIANTATSTVLGLMAGGAVGGAVNAVVGLGSSIYGAYKNRELSKTNELLNVDNLKNAPNSITGAKGNVIFNSMYSDMGVVVERHEILPNEKKMVDDNMMLYGMTLNKVSNIKDYDNMRRYHNYIEANIQGIKGIALSNAIQDDIRQRFVNGVRFWNADKDGKYNVSYKKENYERWLEA